MFFSKFIRCLNTFVYINNNITMSGTGNDFMDAMKDVVSANQPAEAQDKPTEVIAEKPTNPVAAAIQEG
jgi:hypothetical protein